MIPEKVNICGIPHKVIMCSDNFDMDIHFGQINFVKAEIKINSEATPELQMQSLFHEILHGMLVMIGRNDMSNDEEFVQALSNAMHQTFELKKETA